MIIIKCNLWSVHQVRSSAWWSGHSISLYISFSFSFSLSLSLPLSLKAIKKMSSDEDKKRKIHLPYYILLLCLFCVIQKGVARPAELSNGSKCQSSRSHTLLFPHMHKDKDFNCKNPQNNYIYS